MMPLAAFPLFMNGFVTSFSRSTVFTPTCSPEHISTLKTLKISCYSETGLMVTSSSTARVNFNLFSIVFPKMLKINMDRADFILRY